MIKSLCDLLVVSDLDGTLLTAKEGIPACNREMLRLFAAMGGRFTVASGRSPLSVERALDGIPLSTPAIVFNGGMLYDYEQRQSLWRHFVPRETAVDAVRMLTRELPGLGVEVLADNDRMYLPAANQFTYLHTLHEQLPYVLAELEEIPGEWFKVLFAAAPAEIDRLEAAAEGQTWEGAYFVRTSPTYYELMPAGIDKGSALRELCEKLAIPRENVVAIGDHHNDISLLRAAGCPVAVGNAVPQLKMVSEREMLPCRDGGVAQLLYELIKRYGD